MSSMQVHFNLKNICIVLIGTCFVYLSYLLWGSGNADHFPDVEIELRDLVSYAILAAETGGHAVTEVHKEKRLQSAKKGETKEGADEFVTRADLISNQLIMDTLKRFPGIRIISEEKSSSFDDSELETYRLDNYAQWVNSRDMIERIPSRKHKLSSLAIWVDPLDATQEYTEDLLEFVTVMVCIVASGQPIFGVIHRPFHNETIFGLMGWGVMSTRGRKVPVKDNVPKKIMVSRSHAGTVAELAKKAFGDGYEVEGAGGSGYKVLRLINGTAELYMHRTAIKKWDTCAGDAIVRAAGGSMLDLEGADQTYMADEPIKNEKGLLVALTNPFTYYQKIEPFLKEDVQKKP